MPTLNIKTRKSSASVRQMVYDLPLVLSGNKRDNYGVRDAFWSGFAHSLYTAIFRAYLHKSRHKKDELGDSWPDHSPRTKAYRKAKRPKSRDRLGILTPSQKQKWWKLYRRYKHYFLRVEHLYPHQAQSLAAKKAWKEIKLLGGRTILETYRKGWYPIMIDKGKLLESLTPGAFNGIQYRTRNRNQMFIITKDKVVLGTRVKYADKHHNPRPNFPQRRLWPEKISPWVRNAVRGGTLAATRKLMKSL